MASELMSETKPMKKKHGEWTASRPWTVYTRTNTLKGDAIRLTTELAYRGEMVHELTGEMGKRTLTDLAGHYNNMAYNPHMERAAKTRADGKLKNNTLTTEQP